MIPFAYAPPITHLFLVDDEIAAQLPELCTNTKLICECFLGLFASGAPLVTDRYRVVLAFPEASSHATLCRDKVEELKATGLHAFSNEIKREDIDSPGKMGMLAGSLWAIAGVLLLNGIPIQRPQAEKLLSVAIRADHSGYEMEMTLMKRGWFGLDYRVGLVRSTYAASRLLKDNMHRFHEPVSMENLLRTMKADCKKEGLLALKP